MAQNRIFVSHSIHDNTWCHPFADAFKALGYDVWYDEAGLEGSEAWAATIQREIESCDVFLLVLTPEAWESKWVQDELQLAIATQRHIVTVLLRDTHVSGFLLTTQWITVIGEEPQTAARATVMALDAPPALELHDVYPPVPPPPPPAYPPETEPPVTGSGDAYAGEWPDIEEERSIEQPAPEESDEPEEPEEWTPRGGYVPPPQPRPAPPPPPAPAPEPPGAQPSAPPSYGTPPPPAPAAPPPASGYGQPAGAPPPPDVIGARDRVPRSQPVETLQFSAYHAGATPVEAPQTLLVYTHIAAQAGKVQSDAGTFTELGSAPQVAKGASLHKVPRNIEITVEPHVEGVTFSPARDRFVWEGEWRRSLFRYTGARELAGTTRTGWIDIYAGRVSPICTITISLSFLGASPVASLSVPHGINVTSNVFDRVFISYSHRDQEPMSQARETYEALGVTAYHDDLLEAGDNFEQRLAEMIRAANVFHLLWSDAAAQSPEVRKEWMLALQANRDARFIRPWYWQQPLSPPPDELRARKISFRYEHLRRRLLRPSTWF